MADSISTIIDLVHPTVSGVGVITTDQIWVLFDQEMDETTIAGGNFFVTGPDFDTWTGPDLQIFHGLASSGSGSDDILESPGFEGLVQGTISFERIAVSGLSVVSTNDIVGSGGLFRTKAIFTPTNRLQADTTYTVYLSGDESDSDSLQTGLSARTVFDTVASGTNVGTGIATFTGGYIGTVQDVYHVTITTAGDVGNSKFTFWRDSDPLAIVGPFKTKESGVLLSDCVSVEFSEGSYVVGDSWHVVVKPRNIYSGNLSWPFKTGSGNIATIPDTTSTTVIGDVGQVVVGSSSSSTVVSTFQLVGTDPADGATNLVIPAGEYTIVATFNEDVDPLTVVSGVDVIVRADPVDGSLAEESGGNALGVLIANPVVNGSTIEIVVASGQIHNNNLISVTLDHSIKGISGNSLGTTEVFEFTSKYDPLYCTSTVLRLKIGLYIQNVPEDTLNLAIHIASRMADSLTWNKENNTDEYFRFVRSQWTCCKAQEILLLNVAAGSGQLKAKELGDLRVEYNTNNTNTSAALDQALACQAKYEAALMAGGRQVQGPRMTIRGECDPDRPPIGRGWIHTRDLINPQTPAANRRFLLNGYRRFRNVYSRHHRKGWWDRG